MNIIIDKNKVGDIPIINIYYMGLLAIKKIILKEPSCL